jgi:hypothetical protein
MSTISSIKFIKWYFMIILWNEEKFYSFYIKLINIILQFQFHVSDHQDHGHHLFLLLWVSFRQSIIKNVI